MLQITRIFRFEMAHALNGYNGSCKNIHGHSYELHVTVSSDRNSSEYIAAPGFIIDFKELKKIVQQTIIDKFDHKLVLSQAFITINPAAQNNENLVEFEEEPSAENLLIYISNILRKCLPHSAHLNRLKLFETRDSYAEWVAGLT
jgi:6-pyruvoyltetrahydropterin/6-carboxytetrahydropterin synthase